MNYFEQELKKVIAQSDVAGGASYVGRACFVSPAPDLRAKLEFVTLGYADHYEALRLTILNRRDGPVDSITIRFSDLFGKKQVTNPNFSGGIVPYIWTSQGKHDWYVYKPNLGDYRQLAGAVDEYLQVYQAQNMTEAPGMRMQQ